MKWCTRICRPVLTLALMLALTSFPVLVKAENTLPLVQMVSPTFHNPLHIPQYTHRIQVHLEVDATQVALADLQLILWHKDVRVQELYTVIKPPSQTLLPQWLAPPLEVQLAPTLEAGRYDLELVADIYMKDGVGDAEPLVRQYEPQAVIIEAVTPQSVPLVRASQKEGLWNKNGGLDLTWNVTPPPASAELTSAFWRATQGDSTRHRMASFTYTPEKSMMSWIDKTDHHQLQVAVRTAGNQLAHASALLTKGQERWLLGNYIPSVNDVGAPTRLHLGYTPLWGGYSVLRTAKTRVSFLMGQTQKSPYACQTCRLVTMGDITVDVSASANSGVYVLASKEGLHSATWNGCVGIHGDWKLHPQLQLRYEQTFTATTHQQASQARLLTAQVSTKYGILTTDLYRFDADAFLFEPSGRKAGQVGFDTALSYPINAQSTAQLGYKHYTLPDTVNGRETQQDVSEHTAGVRIQLGSGSVSSHYTARHTSTEAPDHHRDQWSHALTLSGWMLRGHTFISGKWQGSVLQSIQQRTTTTVVKSATMRWDLAVATSLGLCNLEAGVLGEVKQIRVPASTSWVSDMTPWVGVTGQSRNSAYSYLIKLSTPYHITHEGAAVQATQWQGRISYRFTPRHEVELSNTGEYDATSQKQSLKAVYRIRL